jgi:hypothetical protein
MESPFERIGSRRTSLRGRKFGEMGDYRMNRNANNNRATSPQELKQPYRRFLSSMAYRAEPDGIDHTDLAVLSKSSKQYVLLLI